jgi:hypothetical protein
LSSINARALTSATCPFIAVPRTLVVDFFIA